MTKHFYFLLVGAVLGIAPLSAQPLVILKDLLPGNGNGVTTTGGDYAVAGGKIYFPGTDTGFPIELCSTDGTPANTKVHGTVSAAEPEFLTASGSRVFFKAYGNNGNALFVSNTASSGAAQVKTFGGPYLEGIYPFDNSRVLLAVNDGSTSNPTQLWASTSSAAFKIADLETRPDFMQGSRFGNSSVFYERSTNFSPAAPFITDGTAAGTKTIADWVAPLTGFSSISTACAAGDLVFISGYKLVGGFQYKKAAVTDGTVAGTTDITFLDDILRVVKRDSATYFLFSQYEVAAYNPITQTVKDLATNVDYFGQQLLHNGKVYYHVQGGIWETNGTAAGTKKLDVTPLGSSFYSPQMVAHDSLLYYTAKGANALELWAKNLNSGANTKITDIYPNNGLIVEPILEVLNGQVVFSRYTTEQGFELWKFGNPPSGVFDLTAAEPLAIFPNPAADYVVLDLPFDQLGGRLSIFDQQGRVVRQSEQLTAARVSLAGLGTGVYWLRYEHAASTKVGKLVVKQ